METLTVELLNLDPLPGHLRSSRIFHCPRESGDSTAESGFKYAAELTAIDGAQYKPGVHSRVPVSSSNLRS
jgi:hypothetical protein